MSEAKIVFWDVEHGHAAYLQSPNGRHIVIDLGTGSYGSDYEFSPLEHLKSQYGVEQLDYVIITHPHVDHIDDIFNFDDMSPKVLLRPKHLDKKPILEKASDADRPKLEKYFEISERYNEPVKGDSYNSPGNPSNWGGLEIKSFVPTKCAQSNLYCQRSQSDILKGLKIEGQQAGQGLFVFSLRFSKTACDRLLEQFKGLVISGVQTLFLDKLP